MIKGITLLSDHSDNDRMAVRAAAKMGFNHLQLSHRIIHNLCDIRDSSKCALVGSLTDLAHNEGIQEVCVWDHCLYNTDYYPDRFKYPGTGLLDLDNEEFWSWLKDDYRQMLSLCPNADGLVLTFIESGGRVEWQYSRMSVAQRLAKVISTVSDVVCKELGKKLWLRTFAYTAEEYAQIVESFSLIEWLPQMGLMVKETPHDFFLTHPDNPLIGQLGHPVLVEFDACGEYNGQGVILGTRPAQLNERWQRYKELPDVVGFCTRSDRFEESQIVGTPMELNLYTLLRASDTPGVSTAKICRDFVAERYGPDAVRHLVPALLAGKDVIEGSMYILGLSTTHHSVFTLEDQSSYARHVPAHWTAGQTVRPGHGVNKELHWWKDLVNSLAPPALKSPDTRQGREIAAVHDAGLLDSMEDITPEYVYYVDKWTADCLRNTRKGLKHLQKARKSIDAREYQQLSDLYERSIMCIELRRRAALCYWGRRAWERDGGAMRSKRLRKLLRRASTGLDKSLEAYEVYDKPYPMSAWDWASDTTVARSYRFNP